jgi:hypothetical protein
MGKERKMTFDVVAMEQEDAVDLLVKLGAPGVDRARRGGGRHIQVALDVGEMMNPRKLFPALRGIHYLTQRLTEGDTFGLVTFGASNEVAFPAGPVGDSEALREVLGKLHPFGLAEPTAGLLLAVRECQRIGARESAIVMISDSTLSAGSPREASIISGMADGAREQGFKVSTICMENRPSALLGRIAAAGGGRARVSSDGTAAARALMRALPGLANKPIRAVSLTVRPGPEVASCNLPDPWPVADSEDGLTLELGDMRAGETLALDFHLEIPGLAELGHREVIEIEAQWTDFKSKRTESARTSIRVNVPEDEPGGKPVDYELKLDLSGPETPQPESGGKASQPPSLNRPRREKKPRRPIPRALEERMEEMVREQTRAEVRRHLGELGYEQLREPGQGPPDAGGENHWPDDDQAGGG